MRHKATPRSLRAACALGAFAIALADAWMVACGDAGGSHDSPSVGPDAALTRDSAPSFSSDSSSTSDPAERDGGGESDADAGGPIGADGGMTAEAAAPGMLYGANIHNGGGDAAANQRVASISFMQET